MKHPFIVYGALFLIGTGIRTTYELLKKNGTLDTRNTAIFAVVFAAMVVMLASWAVMCPQDPWRIQSPGAARAIGIAAIVGGCVLAVGGLVHLRGLENIDRLVTSGLFAKLRHPMYSGFILWILGWIVYYGAVMSLLLGVVCIGNILYWRSLEERQLEKTYGEVFVAYKKTSWF